VEDGESGKIEFLISVCLGSGGAHLVANNIQNNVQFLIKEMLLSVTGKFHVPVAVLSERSYFTLQDKCFHNKLLQVS